jgi:hypothetical protein
MLLKIGWFDWLSCACLVIDIAWCVWDANFYVVDIDNV